MRPAAAGRRHDGERRRGLPLGMRTASRRGLRLGARTAARGLALAFLPALLAGCDDQIKYVPIFSTMSEQASIETYEEQPWLPPEGAVPVDGVPQYDLLEADTLLQARLGLTEEVLARGEELFGQFCAPCHGKTGQGDGSVVGPNRIPALPTLNLMAERARGFSDGYLWGMVANGRGLMPAYKRIAPEERWAVVAWVRELQRRPPDEAAPAMEASAADAGGSPAGSGGVVAPGGDAAPVTGSESGGGR